MNIWTALKKEAAVLDGPEWRRVVFTGLGVVVSLVLFFIIMLGVWVRFIAFCVKLAYAHGYLP